MISQRSTPILYIVTFIIYIYSSSIILKKLELHPPNDLIEFISSQGLKIDFYKIITKILKFWNALLLVFLILIFILAILFLFMVFVGFILIVFNIINANNSNIPESLFNNSIIQSTLIALAFSVIILTFSVWIGFAIFSLVFSQNKLSGFLDTSDIPILFIVRSIDEIKSLDFSSSWEDIKQNKNKISNLINDALEFIIIDDRFFAIPLGMRYHQQFIKGLKNESAKRDILYHVNGLSYELSAIIIKLDCMNTVEDKEEICNQLQKYLKIKPYVKLKKLSTKKLM